MGTYVGLRENIVLVNGAKRGLIQDLHKKKIYSIDELSKKYLNELLSGSSLNNILFNMDENIAEEFKNYLDDLKEKELIYYSDNKTAGSSISKEKLVRTDLKSVWLELRRACNLNCCHCYLDSSIESDSNLNILTLKEWISLIDELESYSLERIILIGGEPLLFDNINKLIEYIRKKFKSIEVILYSNLTLLNNSNIDCIRKNNVKVITSIYSNIPKVHDIITRRKGSFYKTVASIKKLRDLNVYVKANTTISKYNIDNIYDIGEFTYKLTGIRGKFDIVRDVGSSKKDLVPKILNEKLSRVRKKAKFKGINKKEFIKNYSGNTCWQGKLNITCDGKIGPCIMGNNYVSTEYNIRTHNLTEIIEDYIIPEFWIISKDYIDECRDCEYRYVCSDCRPVCSEKGNIYAKGGICTYNPYLGVWGNL